MRSYVITNQQEPSFNSHPSYVWQQGKAVVQGTGLKDRSHLYPCILILYCHILWWFFIQTLARAWRVSAWSDVTSLEVCSPWQLSPWAGFPASNCKRVHEYDLSSQRAEEGAGQSPLPGVSQQIPMFADALVQPSLKHVQTSPPLGTNSSTMAASKNSLPQTLKSQIPFHQIYDSCRDPFDHRERRLYCSQDMMLVSASHALIIHYSPKFYLERCGSQLHLQHFIASSKDTMDPFITVRLARDYHKS